MARAQQLGPILFQGEQIRANRLAAGSGLAQPGLKIRVATLVTVSNATYGEKSMHGHGVYRDGKAHITP